MRDMDRLLMISTLRPSAEGEYDRVHSRIPDAVAEALRRAGFVEYTIWREGRTLVHLVEAQYPAAALDAAAMDPAVQAWNERMDALVESFTTDGRGDHGLRRLWRLSDQPSA